MVFLYNWALFCYNIELSGNYTTASAKISELLVSLQVWFSNVPHTRLVEDKGGQNWIKKDGEKFKFPGGGTQFIHGADSYLDQISEVSWL